MWTIPAAIFAWEAASLINQGGGTPRPHDQYVVVLGLLGVCSICVLGYAVFN